MDEPFAAIGRRVLVIGVAGSGKSTFSRALSARTGLPVIHLDFHYWKPGWVKPSDDEWRERQRSLLAGDAWIADGNDAETLELRLERAETVVLLDTPWFICAGRAFARGLRKPAGEIPSGCDDSVTRRLRDEWRLVGSSGAIVVQNLSEDARSSRSTDGTRHCTCSGRNGQLESFWQPVRLEVHGTRPWWPPLAEPALLEPARYRPDFLKTHLQPCPKGVFEYGSRGAELRLLGAVIHEQIDGVGDSALLKCVLRGACTDGAVSIEVGSVVRLIGLRAGRPQPETRG